MEKEMREKHERARKRTWRIVQGDRVFVAGFSQFGKVLKIDKLESNAVVEDVNKQEVEEMDKFTLRQFKVVKEMPVSYDSLYLVDPRDGQPCGSRFRWNPDQSAWERYSKRSGEVIPWPDVEDVDYQTYDSDTDPLRVLEVTYTGN